MAAINSVLFVRGCAPLILDRSQAYLGVLIDDLVTLGTKEPYRLFTSRAEYRLLLREDNADLRLRAIGRDLGLVDDPTWQSFQAKEQCLRETGAWLEQVRIKPQAAVNDYLTGRGSTGLTQALTLAEMLRRPELSLADILTLAELSGQSPPENGEALTWREEIELQVKYAGYIRRQEEQIVRFRKLERIELPEEMSYKGLPGLSNEVVEKLTRVQPRSLGQASRISGVTPAALSVLQVHLKRLGRL